MIQRIGAVCDCTLMRLSRWMLRIEVFAPEWFLALCSLAACYSLWHEPSNFDGYPAHYSLMARIQRHEEAWATLILFGAVLKVVGLGLTFLRSHSDFAYGARVAGLCISGLFWLVLGASYLEGDPDDLFGPICMLMGLVAWWTLARFPQERI